MLWIPFSYILLTNSIGEFYFLTFGYSEYRAQGLYFRQGAAVTCEAPNKSTVLMQNFVLFKCEVPPENKRFIPGLLAMPLSEFAVKTSTVEELAKENAEVEKLVIEFASLFNEQTYKVVELGEAQFTGKPSPEISKEDMLRALLLLKGESYAPKKAYYPSDNAYSGFARTFLQGRTPDSK